MQRPTTPIRQNRLANLLIEASPVAILLTNPMRNIEVVNQVTEAWFGYREVELFGQSIDTLFCDGAEGSTRDSFRDDASRQACFLAQADDSVLAKDWDLLGRRKDGSEFPVRVTLHPLLTVSGEMLLANVMDLSGTDPCHRKRIEGERLAAVLEMVSGLAHESRNALHRAQSCLDLLDLDLSDQPDLMNLTGRIRTALRDLHKNYEEVKSYAAPITLHRSIVRLPELCRSAIEELADRFPLSEPSLNMEDDADSEQVSVDPDRMTRVFHNLFENAIHASATVSTIHWACRTSQTSTGTQLEITVRDHGLGLTEEVASRMFEPFFTTKSQGTGLGLAVCRRIVEAHGGSIKAGNHPQGGVMVEITLPTGL